MILGGHRLAEFVHCGGFTDVQVLNYKIPCGPWAIGPPSAGDSLYFANSDSTLTPLHELTIDRNAKLSGRHALEVWLGAIDSLSPIFNLSTKQWNPAEKDELIMKVKEEISDTKLH